jgi:glycosyltransferase involved in cell wall biosynthesis
MRRILLLSAPLSLRGTSLYTVSLARELKLLGHKVAVLCPGGTLEGLLEEQDIEPIRAPVHGGVVHDLLYLNVFVDKAREFDPEVVHVQSHALGLVGMLLARALDAAPVLTVHSSVRAPLNLAPGPEPFAIAVSEDVRQALVTSGRYPRDRIEVIPNGVSANLSALELENEKPDERGGGEGDDVPVVGTLNRLARGRGVEHLLDAARAVLDAGANVQFLIVGEGPAERSLRAKVRALDLTAHVTFALPRARIGDLIRPMDVFVSAGESEGHGMFILCAMAEARPVICTGVGGVLSFVRDGENGLLVPRGDVPALSQRILGLLGAPEERRRLGRQALHDVREGFALHPMVERTVEVYERAAAETPAAVRES